VLLCNGVVTIVTCYTRTVKCGENPTEVGRGF